MHPHIKTLVIEDDEKKESESFGKQLLKVSVGLSSLILALIYTYIGHRSGRFLNPTDFAFQREFFGVWGLAALLFGLNVGFTNPSARLLWTCTDIVWISTALLSLSGILSPVEQHVMGLKAENARSRAKAHYEYVLKEIAAGVKTACIKPQAAAYCVQWTKLQQAVNVPEASPQSLLWRLQTALPAMPVHAATQVHLDRMKKAQSSLAKAIDEEAKARSVIEDVDLSWPYWNVFVLTVALGLRAGKTGADIPKSWAEWRASRAKDSGASRVALTKVMLPAAEGLPVEAHVRETCIDFIVPGPEEEQSVITLGGDRGTAREIMVAHSLESLANGFPTLARVELAGAGAVAAYGLVNMDRVRHAAVRDTELTLEFVDGHELLIARKEAHAG